MARSIWKGSVSFGLVNIPIALTSATESHRVGFHEFERGTNKRIRYRRVSEGSNREVPWEKIEKGFEVGKGRYVMLTDEELEAAEPRKSHTIDIEQFVPLAEIDPVNWEQTYYVAPDGEAGAKAYGLLRQAMEEQGRVAIGRFVMRTKEYVVCIRPFERVLALHTMYFPDEVRSAKELDLAPRKTSVGKQELALAGQLISSLAGHWDPGQYKDTFRERVMELVRKKDNGEDITTIAASEEKPGKVIDLMEALKATLAGGKHGKTSGPKSGQESGKKSGKKNGTKQDGHQKHGDDSGKNRIAGAAEGAESPDGRRARMPAGARAQARQKAAAAPARVRGGRGRQSPTAAAATTASRSGGDRRRSPRAAKRVAARRG